MWKNELAAKTAEKNALYKEYETLKSETYKVEKIRASVKVILHSDEPQPERTKRRSQNMEL